LQAIAARYSRLETQIVIDSNSAGVLIGFGKFNSSWS